MITPLLLTALQIAPPAIAPEDDIVVVASLSPVEAADAPASITLFDERTIDALALPLASDLVRLAPGVSVATTGAQGTETVVRIRGAESNHTLVFIDGIAFNDIAAANAARFDALTGGSLGRLELIRGPQSALWGSEALGGVVAMGSPDPLGSFRARASAEYGSRDSLRGSAELATGGDSAGLSATAAFARSDGIDIIGGGAGDRDGFENVTLSLLGLTRFGDFELGGAGRYIHHEVDFDGTDPVFFTRADTLDASTIETVAVRGWLAYGYAPDSPWSARVEIQHLDSENRNRVGATRTTTTSGARTRFGGRLTHRFGIGATRHELTAAIEREEEDFSSRDLLAPAGPGNRDLSRARTAFVGEWRAEWGDVLVTDIAVRHDDFNRFQDATTLRANAVLNLGGGFSLLAGYGEGIAQPSFVDLFGFPGFPFAGNPNLTPERSRGFEGGLRWRGSRFSMEAVAFSNDLKDEIVEDFSVFPSTVINAAGESRRRGFELSAEWRPSAATLIGANYTYLDSREQTVANAASTREIRRPRHTANAYARWESGPFTLGASLAYVGARLDRDFDLFPSPIVRLDSYVLGSARVAYRIIPWLEVFARAENAFDADYQDVFGYATPGASVHAGLGVTFGR
jgi:vitamin B12 transporter